MRDILTLVIVDGLPFRVEDGISYLFARHSPVPFDWSRNLTTEEVSKIQHAITEVLTRGGAPVNPDGLAPLIRSEEMPQPIFWRYLLHGLENLLNPPKPWLPSDEEIRKAKELAARDGITFFEALTTED